MAELDEQITGKDFVGKMKLSHEQTRKDTKIKLNKIFKINLIKVN